MTLLLAGVTQAAEGTGGVVEIEGEPGAGKSRLMSEFQARLPVGTRIALGQFPHPRPPKSALAT
jgi:predicted ATPase